MKRTNWTVGEYSVRPAGKPNECFYCGVKVGEQHKEGCTIRSRTVNLDVTIHMVMDVPEDWSEEQINFHYNMGSWCASNLLSYLEIREENERCLCNITDVKYAGEAAEEDEDRYGCCLVDELES
jgi:hypothetical protein